jgi:hypothetical protein
MNKILTLLSIIFTVSVFGQDDPKIYLEPEHIIGDWVLITSKPSPIPGYFEFDTTVFHVYKLSESEKYTYIDLLRDYGKSSYLTKPMGMSILSRKNREIRCFMQDPQPHFTTRNDYSIAMLEYSLAYDYYSNIVSFKTITFVMLEPDYLELTIGSYSYNLRKGVPYVQEPILP